MIMRKFFFFSAIEPHYEIQNLKNQAIIINFFSTNPISLCQISTTSQIQNGFKHSIFQAIQLYVCIYVYSKRNSKPLFYPLYLSSINHNDISSRGKIILQGYISIGSWNFHFINKMMFETLFYIIFSMNTLIVLK